VVNYIPVFHKEIYPLFTKKIVSTNPPSFTSLFEILIVKGLVLFIINYNLFKGRFANKGHF
jgi:hypothetical protein